MHQRVGWGGINACNNWLENPERKIPLGRPIRRWMDNIKTDITELACENAYRNGVAWNRVLSWAIICTVVNFLIPRKTGNFFFA
jgi:hypothetical protein